jgi:hypothetical protein
MIQKILAGLIGAAVVAVTGWMLLMPSPRSAAIHFVKALPSGNLSSIATPTLLNNPNFKGAISQWSQRDKTQHLTVQQGPYYADTEARGLTSATVEVVAHYAEVYPGGKVLNWEQDFSVTLQRHPLGAWKVSGVRTTVQAVVQVLSGYPVEGPTNLIAPVSIYLPSSSGR